MSRLLSFLSAFLLAVSALAQPLLSRAESADLDVSEQLPQPDRMADDFVSFRLVVAEPGSVLYSVLGHACLHAQCRYYGLNDIYSYESEQVRGRLWSFLTNQLMMGMMAFPPEAFLIDYEEDGRGVREYELNLPPEVETELWRVLDMRLEEGIELKYDYIKRGCALSVLNCLREAVRSANELHSAQSADTCCYHLVFPDMHELEPLTLRDIFCQYAPEGWGRFFCMTIVGGEVDNPRLPLLEKVIAPVQLVELLRQTTINGSAVILSPPTELLQAVKYYGTERFTPLHFSLVVLLITLFGFFGKRPYADWLILALHTSIGCLMLWLLLSPLPGSEWNWLIVVFNPLPAVFWCWRRYWRWCYVALIVVWSAAMLLSPHCLVEPAHLILAAAFAVVLLRPLR